MNVNGKCLIWCCAVFALGFVGSSRGQENPQPIEVGINHRLVVSPKAELSAEIYVYNRSNQRQTFRGEVLDDKNQLLLSGDWDLRLEEVKGGKVISTQSLVPKERPEASIVELPANGNRHWKVAIPVNKLVTRTGNYRFVLSLGAAKHTGRLFRVSDDFDKPDWVSLSYTPDKKNYLFGEPIKVRLVMKNNGEDEFHFEEGGDYRGSPRHLRYAFTAESSKGEKAVDPHPDPVCMGGQGMYNPHLRPEKTYEKELLLLDYLKFPAPGKYTVKCYQDLGFGTPVAGLEHAGPFAYASGGSFEIELRVPTPKEAHSVLQSLFAEGEDSEQREYCFSTLRHPSYLQPLVELLKKESDEKRASLLLAGIGSIMTIESTKQLIILAKDKRPDVRIAAMRHLSWRLPDPRDTGKASPSGPFRFYSSQARLADVKSSWDESFRKPLREIFIAGLNSQSLEEVAGAAYCLGAMGETDTVELLAQAADRITAKSPLAEENAGCANQIADSCNVLAQLGAKPCRADKHSSAGRLAIWANMVREKKEHRTDGWEDLVLHMMNMESTVTRMAAIRWLPEDFSRREEIPWEKLFMEQDSQIWWHTIQVARQKFPKTLKSVVQECSRNSTDQRKQGNFEELLKEIEAQEKNH
jgi:hypothetical protein